MVAGSQQEPRPRELLAHGCANGAARGCANGAAQGRSNGVAQHGANPPSQRLFARPPVQQHSPGQARAVPSPGARGAVALGSHPACSAEETALKKAFEGGFVMWKRAGGVMPHQHQRGHKRQHRPSTRLLAAARGILQPGHGALRTPLQPPSVSLWYLPKRLKRPPWPRVEPAPGGQAQVWHGRPRRQPRLRRCMPRSAAQGARDIHSICMCNYPGVVCGAVLHAQVTIHASKYHLW